MLTATQEHEVRLKIISELLGKGVLVFGDTGAVTWEVENIINNSVRYLSAQYGNGVSTGDYYKDVERIGA